MYKASFKKGSQQIKSSIIQKKEGTDQSFSFIDNRKQTQKIQQLQKMSSNRTTPDVVQRIGKAEVKDQYRYLNDDEQKKYVNLAEDVKQELYKNSSLNLVESAKFSKGTEEGIFNMLSSIEGLHFGSNPELGVPWQKLVDSYNGSKTGGDLYSHIRSPGFANVLKTFDINWGSFAKSPEIHHLIYKKEEPKSAVAPWNLMLSTRGSTRKNVVGQHEGMLHQVSSPKGRPNISQSVYVNEVPAVKGIIRRWGQGERPAVSIPDPLYNSSYDFLKDLGMGENPTGGPFSDYFPSFPYEGLDLRTAERDNTSFSGLDYFQNEHDHDDFFDDIMMQPSVNFWNDYQGLNNQNQYENMFEE